MSTRVACCKARPHLGSLGVDSDEVTLKRVREHEACAAAAAAATDAGGGHTGGAESIEREGEREDSTEQRLAQIGLQCHRDAELLVEGDAHLGSESRVEWWAVVGGGGMVRVVRLIMVVACEAPWRPRL